MNISSTTLALYLLLMAVAATNAFVLRPRQLNVPQPSQGRTTLGYIKDGYDTGIGPDILRKQEQRQRQRQRQQQEQQQEQRQEQRQEQGTAPPVADPAVVVDPIIGTQSDAIIDAVVIEEDFHYDDTAATSRIVDGEVHIHDEVAEAMKKEFSTKNPRDVFPDLSSDSLEDYGYDSAYAYGYGYGYDYDYDSASASASTSTSTSASASASASTASSTPSIWDTKTAETIQGGALRTWSMESPEVDYTQVLLKSTHWDSPLHAQIDVWNGPGHAPMKLAVYCAASPSQQPFSIVVPTPGLNQQSIGIKNSGPLQFPMEAVVVADVESARKRKRQQQQQQQQTGPNPQRPSETFREGGYQGFYGTVDPTVATDSGRGRAAREKVTSGLGLFAEKLRDLGDIRKIEGTTPVQYATADGTKSTNDEVFVFEKDVDSVQVLIETTGLSCQARIEVTSDGTNEIQQVVELSIDDGKERPFFAVLDTSLRSATTVRVINLDPYSAFPITACVEPYTIRCDDDDDDNDDNEDEEEDDDKELRADAHVEDFDFIDASIEDEQEETSDEETIANGVAAAIYEVEDQECEMYSVPDVTIPESLADYDFDQEFFFAN